MPATKRFNASFGRLPGRTRTGSTAFYNKAASVSAREGMAEVIRNFDQLIKRLKNATPLIIHDALVPAFNKSQIYVPKKTGALMESGRLDVVPGPDGVEAEISYGGSTAPYAAIVHEATWRNHASPTRAKYLQAALEEEFDAFLVSIATDYSQLL